MRNLLTRSFDVASFYMERNLQHYLKKISRLWYFNLVSNVIIVLSIFIIIIIIVITAIAAVIIYLFIYLFI